MPLAEKSSRLGLRQLREKGLFFLAKGVFEASRSVAVGVKLSGVKCFPMYPITPATHIAQEIASMVNNGDADIDMITVESEHSAASAVFGAEAAGVRSFTATSSQGLALMFEILPILSSTRLPAVIAVANRALSGPINIWNDHSDSVSVRDHGLLQLWCESSQECLDSVIQAYKVAEDKDVLLPVMVNLDGFTLSHVYEPVDVPCQKAVDSFLPEYAPSHSYLDPARPLSIGAIGFPTHYMEFKLEQQRAMERSANAIKKVNRDFEKEFGRSYGDGMVEFYMHEGAEYFFVGMGTLCGTARVVVDEMRAKGHRVGLARIRALRPFPKDQIKKIAKDAKGFCVIDRHISLGFEGPLSTDMRSSLYGMQSAPTVMGFIAGLGGRDITKDRLEKAMLETISGKQKTFWLV